MNNTDLEQKKWEIPDGPAPTPSPPDRSGRKRIGIVSAILVVAVAVTLWFFMLRPSTVPDTPPAAAEPIEVLEEIAAPLAGEATSEANTPARTTHHSIPLNESDETLRQKAAFLSRHSKTGTLLKEGDLIRRFVAVSNAVALGESPARLLESIAPGADFKVMSQDDRIFVDPVTYRRYDQLVNMLLSLDADQCAELYLSFEPQIEEAYKELGQSEPKSFLAVLQKAVAVLRQTPIPPDRSELSEKTISYAWGDPNLEALSAAQKHFMRLGPAHLRQLQGKFTHLLDTLLRNKKA